MQCSAQPTADGERLGPVDQIFLWNLDAKTWKRPEDLQAAANQYKQRNRIHPVTQAHDERMLVHDFGNLAVLRIFDFNDPR